MKEASFKRPHIVQFRLCEMPSIGTETKSRLAIVRVGGGSTRNKEVADNGYGVYLGRGGEE